MHARSFLLLVLVYGAIGCGPVYRTNYSFTPPGSAQGKACIFQCDNVKLQCEQLVDAEHRRCTDRAEYDYNRCEDRNRDRRDDKKDYCYRSYCARANYSRCEQRYRSCYQTCGGKVTSQTVCVRNCEDQ